MTKLCFWQDENVVVMIAIRTRAAFAGVAPSRTSAIGLSPQNLSEPARSTRR